MTPERWQQVEEVLQAALDSPESERAAFLAEACSGDQELQKEATLLIEAYEQAGDFLEQPALAQDAHVLLVDDDSGRVGDEIGPYKIIARLGRGGMGDVYLADDRRLGRQVALKVLPPYFVADEARLRRFQTEARAASALNHPNIITIYEVGQSEEIHFIAAEHIDGQTIGELIRSHSLTLGEVCDIAIQLGTGLSAAHAAGIVHRDIKPENVMRRRDGTIRILDFGIAKLMESSNPDSSATLTWPNSRTEIGAMLGTIGYSSPEQVRGLPVDERTDIWSSGVVLYEMLTGQRPFSGMTNADTTVAILEHDTPPLFQNATNCAALQLMQRIVSKALSKRVDDRYQTAAEMLADLNAVNRVLDNGNQHRKQAAISSETRVIEVNRIVAEDAASRRVRRVLISTVAAALVFLIAAGLIYRFGLDRRTSEQAFSSKVYAQMTEAEQLNFLSEQEQRISAMMGERPVKLSDEALRAIKAHVDYYASHKEGGPPPEEAYQHATPHVPTIARAFTARRIPIVIGIYLAMLESAYQPCAESSLGAKGIFQFMPRTAEDYGVARADMCNVDKMAPAAAHYIADRMAELGDDSQSMTLVLLSYNRGAEPVRDALRQLRETDRNYERNFWTLYANRDKLDESFRRESFAYVPGFFAVAIIGENPKAFGLGTPPLSSLAQ